MKRFFLLVVLLFFLFHGSEAQPMPENERIVKLATLHYQKKNYAAAYDYYERAFRKGGNSSYGFMASKCAFALRDFQKALSLLEKVKEIYYGNDFDSLYLEALMANGKYAEVKQYMTNGAIQNNHYFREKYSFCDSVASWVATEQNWEVINIKHVNTEYSEISPAIYEGGLVFSSNRPGVLIEKTNLGTEEYYYDLYYSHLKTDSSYGRPAIFSNGLNTTAHETSVTFDSSFTEVYLARSTVAQNNQAYFKLYKASKNAPGWNHPWRFIMNDSSYTYTNPFLVKEGNAFLFSSDMPGGYGGMDLYICYKNGEQWTLPENLGAVVNSPQNEYFPFMDETGNIYFSSNGHPGIGGYDLYKAEFSERGWDKIVHLEMPVNSFSDDISLVILSERQLLVCSNRPGGKGKEDIYKLILKK